MQTQPQCQTHKYTLFSKKPYPCQLSVNLQLIFYTFFKFMVKSFATAGE